MNNYNDDMEEYDIVNIFDNKIELYLDEFCKKHNIDNMKKESQNVWTAALKYIYNNTIKGTKILKLPPYDKQDNFPGMTNYNAYNINLLIQLVDYYIYLCGIYDKDVSIYGFCTLTGIPMETICEWHRGDKLGELSADVWKKLKIAREKGLTGRLTSSGKNPVGVLAILNHEYKWNKDDIPDADRRNALPIPVN